VHRDNLCRRRSGSSTRRRASWEQTTRLRCNSAVAAAATNMEQPSYQELACPFFGMEVEIHDTCVVHLLHASLSLSLGDIRPEKSQIMLCDGDFVAPASGSVRLHASQRSCTPVGPARIQRHALCTQPCLPSCLPFSWETSRGRDVCGLVCPRTHIYPTSRPSAAEVRAVMAYAADDPDVQDRNAVRSARAPSSERTSERSCTSASSAA
jgi:hypothetical protein